MARRALELSNGAIQRTPALLEATEAATVPTGNGIPRAGSDGKLDPGWIGGPLPIAVLPIAADGEISDQKAVRADDARLGNPPVGGELSGTLAAANVVRLLGRPLALTVPLDHQVLGWNDALARWEPMTPASSGGSLTVKEEGGTTVTNVAQITVSPGSLTDLGGGGVRITTGGGGGTASPGAALYLLDHYR